MTRATQFRRLYCGSKVSGFIFLVDDKFTWDTDPDALRRIGLWITCFEKSFRGGYITTRKHGGFAIFFRRVEDADTFLNQCLLNASVFTDAMQIFLSIPMQKTRTPTTQLPGSEDRSLSAEFPQLVLKKLSMDLPSPLGGHTVRVRLAL